MAWNHHEKSEEEKKAFIWGAQNWLQEAQQRTQRFYQEGGNAPVTWVSTVCVLCCALTLTR